MCVTRRIPSAFQQRIPGTCYTSLRRETGKSMRPAGVLCQCNAAVMPDRCSVRPMARDRGCPRVLHRPIRAAGALRYGRCGKLCSPRARQVKRALRSGDVGN